MPKFLKFLSCQKTIRHQPTSNTIEPWMSSFMCFFLARDNVIIWERFYTSFTLLSRRENCAARGSSHIACVWPVRVWNTSRSSCKLESVDLSRTWFILMQTFHIYSLPMPYAAVLVLWSQFWFGALTWAANYYRTSPARRLCRRSRRRSKMRTMTFRIFLAVAGRRFHHNQMIQ